MEHYILAFIEYFKDLSYFGVLLALCFEFVPAELVLPLAGYWVYQGDMTLWGTVLAGTVGGTIGPLTLYALGRYGGRPFLIKYGKYIFINEENLSKADAFFEKNGAMVAFTARFLPGVRTLISIPCGMAKMNVWIFSIYTFAAMLPITFLYVFLGFKLGDKWEEVGGMANDYLLPAGVVIVIVFLLYKFMTRKAIKPSTFTHKN
ncbi:MULTISPECIES: DedA family protein [Metabacillus]|jgi:membrane protein DedA with SNARE-associated domain|uniref:DedA family protein n=1 Tax=Metabacillus hrfriensis TaxID=3048891 RepID=A0ACD4RG07_9BACI|nr:MULTISPECIES: DedA family protein [Metabacillus]UAL53862.1 DedA family protein [Metabacillus dongyingensis]WHZ59419.1 DedA family protein [Metabacillus sp. CT-WN-B3]